MSNGHANCVLAVCCPPKSREQKNALAQMMAEALRGTEDYSAIAGWVVDNFDLAPSGTLQPFKDAVAKLARENL